VPSTSGHHSSVRKKVFDREPLEATLALDFEMRIFSKGPLWCLTIERWIVRASLPLVVSRHF